MADYVNYSIVSWTDVTPISSIRLNQMSTNIEQVKIANEDKPRGLLKISNTVLTNGSSSGGGNEFANIKLASLDLVGGIDNRVSLDPTRYYRLTLSLPGITQALPGGEDGTYDLRFCKGNGTSSGNTITTYTLNSGASAYFDLAGADANIGNLSVRTGITFGAGVYSVVYSALKANESFFIEIQRRSQGSALRASTWALSDSSLMQFYIEDVGGVA
jgi:hypothetical protein